MDYAAYLQTEGWKRLRRFLLHLRGFACERCGLSSPRGVRLEVHHRTYTHLGDERPADLEVLCDDCHRKHHRPPVRGAWARVHDAVRQARIRLGKAS